MRTTLGVTMKKSPVNFKKVWEVFDNWAYKSGWGGSLDQLSAVGKRIIAREVMRQLNTKKGKK